MKKDDIVRTGSEHGEVKKRLQSFTQEDLGSDG
jgi:hypothetical protein